jgi:hypothetical protein
MHLSPKPIHALPHTTTTPSLTSPSCCLPAALPSAQFEHPYTTAIYNLLQPRQFPKVTKLKRKIKHNLNTAPAQHSTAQHSTVQYNTVQAIVHEKREY